MTNPISRRSVLRGIALGATAPVWVRFADPSAAAATAASTPAAARHLLVVFLRGGNDPLNTIAPMGDAALVKLRPSVALRDSDMLNMGNGYGMNKHLPSLFEFWRAGQLAAVQHVGTAIAGFSHTTQQRRWETADPNDRFATGWLGRYLDATPDRGTVRAAAFGDSLPLSLVGERTDGLSLQSIDRFGFNDTKLADVAARRAAVGRLAAATAPQGSAREMLVRAQQELLSVADPLAKMRGILVEGRVPTQADNAAQLFASALGTEIGFLNLDGYDVHINQRGRHALLMSELDDVVRGFFASATKLGVRDQSVMLIVSEFGRRVYENRSGGTDHGGASTVVALGSAIKGGMYGPKLDVAQLDDGNLATRVDLRSVYATMLSSWLRTDPTPILGAAFPTIPLFR